MQFFVVALIFISCMIALALLIYYCQEYRNPKYSFTDNQRDISSIALAIGVPGFQPGEYRTAPHSPDLKSTSTSPQPPPTFVKDKPSSALCPPGFTPTYTAQPPAIGFVTDKNASAPYPTGDLRPFPTVPKPREYVHTVAIPEYSSDDCSTSSEEIYYSPKTAAYSVAKRMSMSANVARRMSAAAGPKGGRPSISADVATFLLAKRLAKNFHRREANVKNDDTEVAQKNKTDPSGTQILENTVAHSSDTKDDSLHQQKDETVQQKSTSASETTSTRSSISRISDLEESKRRRSGSPYIPATVVAFHLKNKTARSGSPYKTLQNDSSSTQEQNNGLSTAKKNESPLANPCPPNRSKKLSIKSTENHPLKCIENDPSKHSEKAPPQQKENICFPKRSESLPPKHSSYLPATRSESLPPKQNTSTSDRLPLTSSEVSYRSHSPTPLHTVEEED